MSCSSHSHPVTSPDAPAAADALDAPGCAQVWSSQPVEVDQRAAGSTTGTANIGFDGSGNAVAVWEQQDSGGVDTVWANTRSPDGAWATPHQVSTTAVATGGSSGTEPVLAVSANGTAIVVWQQYAGDNPTPVQNVWASRYIPGTGWSAEQTIEAPPGTGATGVDASDPRVAIDSQGNAVVVWSENDGDPNDNFTYTYANRFTAATATWSGAVRLVAPTPLSASQTEVGATNPAVALDDSGAAVAVWMGNVSNVGLEADAALFQPATQSWQRAVYLDGCAGGANACNSNQGVTPRVAFDSHGHPIVVWQEVVTTSVGVLAWTASYSGSAWSAASALSSVANADEPRVATDSNGNALAVWQDGINGIVYAAVSSAGTWHPALALSTNGNNGNPALAFDDAGNALVVWDTQETLQSARFVASAGAFAATQTITTGTSATAPALAMSHGTCPTALTLWPTPDQQPPGSGAGMLSLAFH